MEKLLAGKISEVVERKYGQNLSPDSVQIEKTRKGFEGDFTVIIFPLLRFSRKSPAETGEELGTWLKEEVDAIGSFRVIGGFLNISLKERFWLEFMQKHMTDESFGTVKQKDAPLYVIEYSSPNTNKPLHLGHIRNNLLGWSIAEILKANGYRVEKINLINDRGIHICKSMLAWQKWGEGETPESSGMKGDHLVGKYYVMFDRAHKKEIGELVKMGHTEDDAFGQAPLMKEAQEMLRKWENADPEVLEIWRLLNSWVYEGFDETYRRLGIDFDQVNHESETYLDGKKIVEEGLEKNVFYKRGDGSVWVNLEEYDMDKKLLLRADGTSVYITQDLGTAQRRYDLYHPEKLTYVVGNEQIYHFNVLKQVMKKLGREWYDLIHHLSYGMVELPQGRMKSREGTVVDADDLMDEMYVTAEMTTRELGKTGDFPEEELKELFHRVSMGALKYYILKVDPKKNILFNPEESIDFNGNTGPFIQYTYARIQSLVRKSGINSDTMSVGTNSLKQDLLQEEKSILRILYEFPETVRQAGASMSPALIANYCYELAREFNHYYQDTPILMRVDPEIAEFRVSLSWFAGRVLKKGMSMLGIELPETM